MSEEIKEPEVLEAPEQSISDPAPEISPDVDAEMDARLLEIEQNLGVEDPEAEDAPKDVPVEGEGAEALLDATEETQPETEGDTERESVSEDLSKAISALRRDGLPKSVIESMSDDQILEIGLKRAKVQSDTDDAFRQLAELKNAGETEAQESEGESSDVAAPADQPPIANLDEALTGFTDIFGEDAAGALKAPLEAAISPFAQQVEAGREQLSTLAQTVENLLIRDARRELADKFPALSSEEGFSTVQKRMETLVKSGGYNDMESLMSDAARIEFSDESSAAVQASRQARDIQRANGQPTPGSSRIPAKALSVEEVEDAVLMALEAGDSVADARRQAGL